MGHTIPAKRNIVYSKLHELEKFAHTLRQPYRERMLQHIQSAYQHISGLVYTNSLDDEESLVYAMLAALVQNGYPRSTPKVRKCLAVLLAEN